MVAWDEQGNLYHFDGGGEVTGRDEAKKFGFVRVGEWDHAKGEPLLVKVSKDESQLRSLLINLLTKDTEKKRWLRRASIIKAPLSVQEASMLSTQELVHRLDAI